MRYFLGFSFTVMLLASASLARGEYVSFEKASGELQAATVTVRVMPQAGDDGAAADEIVADEEAPARRVTVCSGASLGKGLVVTYAEISANDDVRITIPGGVQAKAKLKVLDHVSGLTLLETDKQDMPSLAIAKDTPNVGGWVLAGAGWGSEKPVVSFGILAGANRALRGTTFPPLLQCDLRTADTSNGAPLVNQQGELIGVVVATGAVGNENRWTYAVPVKHVQRLIRARQPNQMIEIKPRRPIVGLKLMPSSVRGVVVVQRVDKGGPAEKAGIRAGDHVIAAEGVEIRSVYEVIRPLLSKQPGETMQFTLQQGDKRRSLEVVLGGGTVIQPKPRIDGLAGQRPAGQVDMFLSTDGLPDNGILIRRSNASTNSAVAEEIDNLKLQRKAIQGYLSALQRMQEKIALREKELTQRDAQIEALQRQVKELQEATGR